VAGPLQGRPGRSVYGGYGACCAHHARGKGDVLALVCGMAVLILLGVSCFGQQHTGLDF